MAWAVMVSTAVARAVMACIGSLARMLTPTQAWRARMWLWVSYGLIMSSYGLHQIARVFCGVVFWGTYLGFILGDIFEFHFGGYMWVLFWGTYLGSILGDIIGCYFGGHV